MKAIIKFVLLFGMLGVICGNAQQALAVNAIWGEEMSAAPGADWGQWDDVSGSLKPQIVVTADPDDASNSVWQIPQGAGNGQPTDFGMARIDPGSGNPDPPTDGLDQFTVEFRYRINSDTAYPTGPSGNVQTFPVDVNIGHVNSPNFRYSEGYVALGATTAAGYANVQTMTAEGGLFGGDPGFFMTEPINPPAFGQAGETARQQWHTVRLVQDDIGDTQKTYLDGVQITEHNTATYSPVAFTRSLLIQQRQQFTPSDKLDSWTYAEVMYDYIRVASGLVPINEPINPVPEPASGLMALVLCGLGIVARRRG